MTADAAPKSLHAVAQLLVESWNRVDAEAFASLFTPDAEYVTGAGERVSGHQAISQLVQEAAPAAQVTLVEEPIAECDATLGQVTFAWSAKQPGGIARGGTIACSCVRQGGSWLIQSLRNSEEGVAGETRGSPTRS